MLPPPPGLFSTTAGWLRLACKPVAISRATTSFEPPGVNGTMMRIALVGKRASAPATSGHAAAPPSVAMNARRDLKRYAIAPSDEPDRGAESSRADHPPHRLFGGLALQGVSLRRRIVAARAHALAQRLEAFLARDRPAPDHLRAQVV